jgi:hypothetical protein
VFLQNANIGLKATGELGNIAIARIGRSIVQRPHPLEKELADDAFRSAAEAPAAYYERLLAAGKTAREARRCVKRALARHFYRRLLEISKPPLTTEKRRVCAVCRAEGEGFEPSKSLHP